MRCEICNKADTEEYLDMIGVVHNYCPVCILEIEETLGGYDDEDELLFPYDPFWDEEEISEEDQEVSGGGSAF